LSSICTLALLFPFSFFFKYFLFVGSLTHVGVHSKEKKIFGIEQELQNLAQIFRKHLDTFTKKLIELLKCVYPRPWAHLCLLTRENEHAITHHTTTPHHTTPHHTTPHHTTPHHTQEL
jgi:hypothetical protein